MSTSFTIGPGPFPGLEFSANENVYSLYHEDREVSYTDPVTGNPYSRMYHAVNAMFDGLHWNLVGTGQAYAMVQDPDGSVHYLTSPSTATGKWTTEQWVGSGNNNVYNVVDYGMSNDPAADPSANLTALLNALTAAFQGGGGVVVIPVTGGPYMVAGEVVITESKDFFPDNGVIIVGMGGSAELVQVVGISDPTTQQVGTMFSFTGFSSGRGIRFRDLRLTYATPSSVPYLTCPVIQVTSCQNVSCERVYFHNCPAFANDSKSTQCGLLDSTVDYSTGVNGATMVSLEILSCGNRRLAPRGGERLVI